MTAFFTMAFVHFLSVVSPGPDFAFVVKNSLQYNRRAAILTAFGISLGVGVHISYCLLSLVILILKSIFLFNIIKFLGATYLIYIGLKALFSKNTALINTPISENISSISSSKAIRQGFICNILNPKASLFILGLFTLIIGPHTPLYVQVFYGIWMMAITFLWFAFLAGMITHPLIRGKLFHVQTLLSRCLGAFLILFGLKLIFAVRT